MTDTDVSCGVDGVIITGELDRRPSRAPDHQSEARALAALAQTMATDPGGVLQQLVDEAMALTRADSAGVSLLEPGGDNGVFRWVATAGAWAPYRDGTMPREESPCGEVVARGTVLLMKNPERMFPALLQAEPGIGEGLLAPFQLDGAPLGTVWVIKHAHEAGFDREDARILQSLVHFASAAYRMTVALKNSEAGLLESGKRLRALANASSEVFYVMNPDMLELRALSGGGFIADTTSPSANWLEDYIPQEDRPRTLAAIREAIRTKGVFVLEHLVRRPGGEIGSAMSRAVPILDADGEIVVWFGTASDVTDRKRAEAALRESEERLHGLVTIGSSMLYRMSPDWRIMHELDGRDVLADTAKPNADWVDKYLLPEDRSGIFAAIEQAIADKSMFELEHRVRQADGSVGWILSRAVPILGPDSEIFEWFGAGSDVTVRKQSEAAVRSSEERQASLLKFSDALRPLGDAVQIQGEATRLLREHYEAGWCCYAKFQDTGTAVQILQDSILSGLPSLVGYHEMQDLPELIDPLLAGKVMHAPDLPAYPFLNERVVDRYSAIGMQSFVGTPLVKEGRLVAFLMLADTRKRHWNDEEIGLLTEVAERTCAAVERARAEATLRAAEEAHRAIFTGTSAGFLVLAPDSPHFTITDVNDAYLHATMTRREDLIGRALFEVFPENPDDPNATNVRDLRASLDRVLATKRRDALPRLKYDIPKPGGGFEERWWDPIQTPLLDLNGAVAAIIHHATEQTDVERAQSSLRESVERLRQFGEASQDILWIRDAETLQWTYLTSAFDGIYGLSREEALSGDNWHNWQELIIDEDRERAVSNIIRVRDGERINFEYRIRRPIDGEIRWLRDTDFPIHDEAGRVVAVGGVGSDVTRLKAIEAQIEANEKRLRTLMEGIPQLVWRSCDKGLWTWSSPQWQAFTGQSQEESRDRGWLAAIHPEDQQVAVGAWEEEKSHGLLDVEYRVRRASDGAWLWHHTRSVPVRDDHGRIAEWLGTTTDVHDLRQLQERQSVMVAELQHRTRNLITVVRSLSDRTVGKASSLDDFKGRFGHRLAALARVQGLLAHLSAGERVDFAELLRSELTAIGAVDGKAERVTLDGPADVPLRSATVQTFALAIHELATNAVKYGALSAAARDGHLAVRWRVDAATSDDPPVLHVEWQESGVVIPQVGAAPRGGGYGRELIVRALPYQLGAETTYEVGADGVRCTIAVPISREGG